MKRVSTLVVIGTLLACGSAMAIPPPWTLEEAKAGAEVVVIAKTTRIESVEGVRGANARIGLEPVEVLKGKLKPDAKDAKLFLLYMRPQQRPGPGGLQRRVVGGTGQPKAQEGQTALMFLRKDRNEPGSFRAVCGSFGYVALSAAGQADREAVKKRIKERIKKRIKMHGDWCARIGNAEIRKAVEGYYAKAADFADQDPRKVP